MLSVTDFDKIPIALEQDQQDSTWHISDQQRSESKQNIDQGSDDATQMMLCSRVTQERG